MDPDCHELCLFVTVRNKLPVSGHEDVGCMPEEPVHNDGNFCALLRYHVKSGDEVLQEHTAFSISSALYISAVIQNDLINICWNFSQSRILHKVSKAKIIHGHWRRNNGCCSRHVDQKVMKVSEDFLSSAIIDNRSVSLTNAIKK
jgi:hypothetical protein